MSIEKQFEREEAAILENEEQGQITHADAMRELRELQRDYAEAARESAREAYDRELERW